jgi:ribose 1,5-bisphosphokinase PhnN
MMLALEHAPELQVGGRLDAVTGPSGRGKTTLLMAMAENPSEAAFFAEVARRRCLSRTQPRHQRVASPA